MIISQKQIRFVFAAALTALGGVSPEVDVIARQLPEPAPHYATLLGGEGYDLITSVAVDKAGAVYVTGLTSSADFPAIGPQHRPSDGLITGGDIFVAKIDPVAHSLVYSTVFGGRDLEVGAEIVVDSAGAAYVVGTTWSGDFPVTFTGTPAPGGGIPDAFLLKVDPTGQLEYSTTIGGNSFDYGLDLAIGCGDHAYISGSTQSVDFPASNRDSIRVTPNMSYLMRFNPVTMALISPRLIGDGEAEALACDAAGHAYLSGYSPNKGIETFVAKTDPLGEDVLFVRYLGGAGYDRGRDIDLGTAGSIYVSGTTTSVDFPVTGNSPRHTNPNDFDAFVAKWTADGVLVYSTVITSPFPEEGWSLQVDEHGRAWVGNRGDTGAVLVLNASGSFSRRERAPLSDQGLAIMRAPLGSLWIAGTTTLRDFPVTPDAIQAAFGGDFDAFLVARPVDAPPSPIPSLRIQTPNDVSDWGIGTTQRLAWRYEGGAARFRVDVSRDGGTSWETVATVGNTPGLSQNLYWHVSGPETSTGRLRVTAIGDPNGSDVNDADIRIAASFIEVLLPASRVVVRRGDSLRLFWKHNLGARVPVAIDVSNNGGRSWRTVATNVLTTGSHSSSYRWVVDAAPTNGARIRVRSTSGARAVGMSNEFGVRK